MRIEAYSFGKVTIDGKTYTSDVIIYPDRVDAAWWRKEGHLLQVADLSEVIREKPDVLIVGTGCYGVMKVPRETTEALSGEDIEVHAVKTSEAVQLFNTMPDDKKAVAALHLTC